MTEGAVMLEREIGWDVSLLDLRAEDGWEQKNGAWWITQEKLEPRAMTRFMLAQDARFMTVTAIEREGGETRLDYHWDLKGVILTFSTQTRENKFPSISDLCPAADWLERETYEYFSVEFTGRTSNKQLMLRPGLEAGLNRRQIGKP
jgi:NADH:ubiquinone oxidoreductase subunit C